MASPSLQDIASLASSPLKYCTLTYILHQATGSRGYTDKTHFRELKTFGFLLVHAGGH